MKSKQLKNVRAAGFEFLVRSGETDGTVVLLHGIGGRASSFASMMSYWPEGSQILAWDCPGYGASKSLVEAAPAPLAYAKALAQALDELEIKSIDLMGQSLGALFAGAFATHYPDRLRNLILMCPALGYQTRPSVMIPVALAQRIAAHENEGAAAFAAARASRLVHDPDRKPDVVGTVRTAMASIQTPAHTQAVYALAQGDLDGEATAWQKHVLLIAGVDDIITPMSGTERLFSTLRARSRGTNISEQLHSIGDAGHAVYLEHPAYVAAVASSFLRSKLP
jgi:pimeloyl-ACP methyl ester carboxylesterase